MLKNSFKMIGLILLISTRSSFAALYLETPFQKFID